MWWSTRFSWMIQWWAKWGSSQTLARSSLSLMTPSWKGTVLTIEAATTMLWTPMSKSSDASSGSSLTTPYSRTERILKTQFSRGSNLKDLLMKMLLSKRSRLSETTTERSKMRQVILANDNNYYRTGNACWNLVEFGSRLHEHASFRRSVKGNRLHYRALLERSRDLFPQILSNRVNLLLIVPIGGVPEQSFYSRWIKRGTWIID